ncbi:uncharacterized protein si:ch1073-126c3.2 [Scomber japonicus]|uniref:uncharacterized protein si:ch1073-126c3.2 n=1 Tax=Scomber japonicus TaxID=13676 RepID=UPI002306A630|nr:uncharacterized protein si:ch1073-126c3.2 [Scomber japonicus]XP_053189660.1 uncharacterized protein si:ch1073-126c3.2 [Scomber japonicus]
MALKETLIWLCSLAVLFFSAASHETVLQDCSSKAQLLDRLSADLKVVVECGEIPPSDWSPQRTASLLLSMRNLTETLHKHQLNECRGAEPEQCPEAEVPDNGGLACVTVADKQRNTTTRYCKPLCNHGFDFGFLRRSRLYDECGAQTRFKWNTQYVGGNKLAVCNETPIQISGAETAYFPKDCMTSKESSEPVNTIESDFIAELKKEGIEGEMKSFCLVCGRS